MQQHHYNAILRELGLKLYQTRDLSQPFSISPTLLNPCIAVLHMASSSEAESKIFSGMLSVLAPLSVTVFSISCLSPELGSTLPVKLQLSAPKRILVLGEALAQWFNDSNIARKGANAERQTACIVSSHAPAELLAKPALKRQAFNTLLSLKASFD